MANPEWGTKAHLPELRHEVLRPAARADRLPKCQTEFDPEAFLKTRRSRPAAVADKEHVPAAAATPDAEEVEDAEVLDDEEAVVAEGAEEEDEDMIEDASELGEDEDDWPKSSRMSMKRKSADRKKDGCATRMGGLPDMRIFPLRRGRPGNRFALPITGS